LFNIKLYRKNQTILQKKIVEKILKKGGKTLAKFCRKVYIIIVEGKNLLKSAHHFPPYHILFRKQ
jgi:hypothetical protein